MSLFRISIRLERDGKWSQQQSDFSGYFVRDSNNIMQGYVVAHDASSRERKHFIAGIYEKDKIVFVKMIPYSARSPMCFVQPTAAQDGYWDTFFPISGGFFANRTFQGHASFSIGEPPKHLSEDQISQSFVDFLENDASPIHIGLVQGLQRLRIFWEETYTPHD